MGKIALNEVENYKSNGGTDFFSLADDRDTAVVRFMYETINDVNLDVVHEIEVDGKTRNVNCLRSYDEPMDNCPLCRAGYKQKVKMFVPVYNEDKGVAQIWQRGKTFVNNISGLCNRYNPLCGTPIEIERQGKKGDQTTKYQLYPRQSDDCTLDDLPEVPNVLGGILMDKTFDELDYFVSNGCFKNGEMPTRGGDDGGIKRRPKKF